MVNVTQLDSTLQTNSFASGYFVFVVTAGEAFMIVPSERRRLRHSKIRQGPCSWVFPRYEHRGTPWTPQAPTATCSSCSSHLTGKSGTLAGHSTVNCPNAAMGRTMSVPSRMLTVISPGLISRQALTDPGSLRPSQSPAEAFPPRACWNF